MFDSGQAIVTASVNGSSDHGQGMMENVLTKIQNKVGDQWYFFSFLFSLDPTKGVNSVNCGGHQAPSCSLCVGAPFIGPGRDVSLLSNFTQLGLNLEDFSDFLSRILLGPSAMAIVTMAMAIAGIWILLCFPPKNKSVC